ncbi:YqaJ viral recombinase family protein [Acinetobacter sp. ANC 5045]|uniref:YqaJ viral recombinase family nuclease n=1 Tax=Acinetobacter sp. ANC 5045 TaxID=2529851 RepID=UPI001039CF3B|nr:YqaJ viral recombinase family protein [Acinetobacter sp. ANC 5045]TCB16107.1 recombinase [Acinetobacter sp. ANC 5045]
MNTAVNLQSAENARQAWLESRRLGIGGSDVAAILGLSKYKSPYQLWLDKTSRSELEDSQSEAAYWGNTLEDIVAKEYAKRNGVKVQRVNATIAHPEHDWMRANIDRAIINPEIAGNVRIKDGKLTTDRILECKTANQYLAKLWGDEQTESVPDYYLTQCQWYMGITGASFCGLGVLIGGQKFRTYEIQFDAELFEMLIEQCSQFWHEHVLSDVPPAPTTFDDVLHRWAKHNPDQSVEADDELAQIITEYKELNSNIKEATTELDQLKLQICTRMEDAEMIIAEEKRLATYKYQERNSLDSKALKAAHPDIYEQFLKTSSTRVLRVA